MSTIVAVVLAGGVVIGMMAVTMDVGNVLWERRQVQNGADASANALAEICGRNTADCNPAVTVNGLGAKSLQGLLNANSSDGRTAFAPTGSGLVNGQCGRSAGVMPGCPSSGSSTDLAQCPPLPTWLSAAATIPYVETHTITARAGGGSLFTPFADALTGSSHNVRVPACARAAWGTPSTYTALAPVTFSVCEWIANTNSGATFVANGPIGAKPGYGGANPWPDASKERVIILHDPSATGNCSYKGKDTDGGFGYLDTTGSGCSVTVDSANPWAQISTGNSVPSGCSSVLATLRGTTIALPVFDCVIKNGTMPSGPPAAGADCSGASGGGAKSWYHIKGWASFYLSGYRVSGSDTAPSYLSGAVPCANPQRCLSGWFLKGLLDTTTTIIAPGSDSDLGSFAVVPAG